ncbi:amino acid ABC transporter permease [Solemya velum gill symbiont]|uniref:amino acid ABC transporter permease n=1 Tax=Solemya velum gill symbiont TaxID=2340 RepID=UPI000998562B|nr:amino acid ABC transporter permease [Solemya velum gill symbiont]OOZ45367.1 amino acid ABC transporter permease [Solemya velum gill symbiont]OOZ56699.1 amino acid ABC transporter permease [Solemya velum gill symbiont]OOZ64615.1 amino acid ABC transporter permease [Solemya velum gill symbiont]OOZ73058.1 amino acid ABC transporter permease [Solemya velum gill symbiont]
MSKFVPQPDLPAPITNVGVIGWLRNNLFPSPLDTAMTLAALYFLYLYVPPLFDWAIFSADWFGDSRDACTSGGACWVFVSVRFKQFMVGLYPDAEVWRVSTAAVLFVALMIPMFIKGFKHKAWLGAFILFGFPFIAFILFSGGSFGLELIETNMWGGLFLTLVLSFVGIVAALPLGILLALGRRSSMPIVKSVCVVFIEFWRGVPLITVLFMSSVMLPLFLPEGMNFDKLLRAMIGIVLFQSAYMAEVVRSGLQAIPKGQYEAAKALGLSYWQSMGLIILPQALKLVIPGIVNTFIALFKDTTLVLIIGLFDLLSMIQSASQDAKWLGFEIEGYVFAALIFWVFCFGMSRYSMSLERKLETSHARN